MSEELKPCPFCNGAPEIDYHRGYRAINGAFGNQVAIYCLSCSAEMALDSREIGASEEEVASQLIAAWNHRPSPPVVDGELPILIYAVEEDEETIRLSINRQDIAAWSAQSPQGIALLKLDAELRSKSPRSEGDK